MKYLITFLAIALVGCIEVGTKKGDCKDKYVVTLMHPHGYERTVWYTPHRPWPASEGYVFRMSDGREIQVSGVVIIEEQF